MATRPRPCIFHKTLGLMLYLLHVLKAQPPPTPTQTARLRGVTTIKWQSTFDPTSRRSGSLARHVVPSFPITPSSAITWWDNRPGTTPAHSVKRYDVVIMYSSLTPPIWLVALQLVFENTPVLIAPCTHCTLLARNWYQRDKHFGDCVLSSIVYNVMYYFHLLAGHPL